MITRRSSSRGMSLVELVVVMAILSVVIMAVMSLYIPAVRTTTVQTAVTDVQSNLRLAADVMTRDLLMAGFLVNNDPIVNETASTMTIRSRLVSGGGGRVESATSSGSSYTLTLSNSDMVDYFPVNSMVRIFNSVNMAEIAAYDETNATAAQNHVYTVTGFNVASSTITVNDPANTLSPVSLAEFREALVLRVRDNTQPPTQTIRYQVAGGNLQRIINEGTAAAMTQILARGVSAVQFTYGYSPTSGRVNKVDFVLTGTTEAFRGEVQTRQVLSSVTLRNVF